MFEIILITVVHILFYWYVEMHSRLRRLGTIYNTPNKLIEHYRTLHGIKINTYKLPGKLYGVTIRGTIYLNESLFKHSEAMKHTYYHEYYHYTHKHTRKMGIARLVQSCVPLLFLVLNGWVVAGLYCLSLISIIYLRKLFEKKAVAYAEMKQPSGFKVLKAE